MKIVRIQRDMHHMDFGTDALVLKRGLCLYCLWCVVLLVFMESYLNVTEE